MNRTVADIHEKLDMNNYELAKSASDDFESSGIYFVEEGSEVNCFLYTSEGSFAKRQLLHKCFEDTAESLKPMYVRMLKQADVTMWSVGYITIADECVIQTSVNYADCLLPEISHVVSPLTD